MIPTRRDILILYFTKKNTRIRKKILPVENTTLNTQSQEEYIVNPQNVYACIIIKYIPKYGECTFVIYILRTKILIFFTVQNKIIFFFNFHLHFSISSRSFLTIIGQCTQKSVLCKFVLPNNSSLKPNPARQLSVQTFTQLFFAPSASKGIFLVLKMSKPNVSGFKKT